MTIITNFDVYKLFTNTWKINKNLNLKNEKVFPEIDSIHPHVFDMNPWE